VNRIDYSNFLKFNNIPKKRGADNLILPEGNNSNNLTNLNALKNNFIKNQAKTITKSNNESNFASNSNDIISLLNEVGSNSNSNSNEEENLQNKTTSKKQNVNHHLINKNKVKKPQNGPLKIQSDNSYVDFIKSLGWDNSSSGSSNSNNIPHLDIYFMNKMSNSQDESINNPQGNNFLAVEEKTKFFSPDWNYVNKVNDPSNGYLWKAKVYDDFVGKSYGQMRNLLGNTKFFKSSSKNGEVSDFLEMEIKVE